jgi:flagellin
MTSILTNVSAISALQTLRTIDAGMAATQGRVSSGLRVQEAADNAAYWSIATTMRSDSKALSTVSDALGLGAAKVGTAYSAMSAVIDTLSEVKSKLVAASEPGVDKAKIQKEIDQLKKQVVGIATSASFAGQNWLNTDIFDLRDSTLNKTTVPASFVRDGAGSVAVHSLEVDLSRVSLFNTSGNGLLQANVVAGTPSTGSSPYPSGNFVSERYHSTGPITLSPSDSISFDVVVHRGGSASDVTFPVSISRTDINAALGISTGTISDASDMASVLTQVWSGNGAGVNSGASGNIQPDGSTLWHTFFIQATHVSPTDSHVSITNLVSTLAGGAAGGLEGASYGTYRHAAPGGSTGGSSGDYSELPINFLDIDVTNGVGDQLSAVEEMMRRTTDAAATLGSVEMRIDLQTAFVKTLVDTISKGVGRLVDADMNEESTRLKALQTQQQLAIQSLQIANSESGKIMALFN